MVESYKKLRPFTEIESCECKTVNGLFLVDILSDNPLHCDFCRRKVDPERINLTAKETDGVAGWFMQAQALYALWLHSGEYEDYAKSRLLDPKGQVNKDGIAVAELLSEKIPARLWLFHDSDDGTPANCPVCGEPLDLDVKWGRGKCRTCRVQI